MLARRLWTPALLLALALGCSEESAEPARADDLELPQGFPEPVVPETNPITAEKAELGRYLFYDERLSGNETQSCGSCHRQQQAFSDGREVAVGSTGQAHARNSLALVNVIYNPTLTWSNPSLTELEQQLLVPLFGEQPLQLGVAGKEDEVIARFRTDRPYQVLFAEAYPEQADPIQWQNIIDALATFVRTLVSGNSPVDRYLYHDDADALPAQARRGMELFYSEHLECHHCHGGFNFNESSVHETSLFEVTRFHNTGLYNLDGKGAYPEGNTGISEVTGRPQDMGRFRAPTLRNVALTAPYMHDGSIGTLDNVVRFYEAGGRVITEGRYAGDGRKSPLKSHLVTGFVLSNAERRDLIRFLESLTDPTFVNDPRFADPFARDAE